MSEPDALTDEDTKLVTLARSSRARSQRPEGAAVRDGDGRTYAAATVSLPSLSLSALQAAVAAAVSSGASTLEAAVVVSETERIDPADLAVVHELGGAGRPVHLVGPDARPRTTVLTGPAS